MTHYEIRAILNEGAQNDDGEVEIDWMPSRLGHEYDTSWEPLQNLNKTAREAHRQMRHASRRFSTLDEPNTRRKYSSMSAPPLGHRDALPQRGEEDEGIYSRVELKRKKRMVHQSLVRIDGEQGTSAGLEKSESTVAKKPDSIKESTGVESITGAGTVKASDVHTASEDGTWPQRDAKRQCQAKLSIYDSSGPGYFNSTKA